MADDAAESRFAHLLKPIRDLAENWNIDIANELEEYAAELDNIRISFDGGKSTLNFAEAALLIQGATCVYSKKVEYLYSLLHHVLDVLAGRKKKLQQASNSPEDDAEFRVGEDAEFLPLDDVMKPSTSIDMQEEDDAQVATFDSTDYNGIGPGTNAVVPRTPLALLSNEDANGNSASARRSTYRLSTCAVHASGAFLLDSSMAAVIDQPPQPVIAAEVAGGSGAGGDAEYDDGADMGGFEPAGDDGVETGDMAAHTAAATPVQPRRLRGKPRAVVEEVDPWTPLDPHDPGTKPPRPLRKGRSYGQRPKTPAPAAAAADSFLISTAVPLKGVLFPELAYAFESVLQRRKQQSRRDRAERAKTAAGYDDIVAGDDDGVDGPADDAIDMAFGDDGMDDIPDSAMTSQPELYAAAVDSAMAAAAAEPEVVLPDYEDLVQEHMRIFAERARDFQRDTEVGRRVSEWQAKMAPLLEDMDSRPAFSVQSYARDILHRFPAQAKAAAVPSNNTPVPFEDLIAGVHNFEVCRVFLSSLQLANNGNVEIIPSTSAQTFQELEMDVTPSTCAFALKYLTDEDRFNASEFSQAAIA